MAASLFLASLLSPVNSVQSWFLSAVWLWPLVLWSEMGVRETCYRVHEILFSSPSPARHQLLATWVAGVLLAITLGNGVLVRVLTEPGLLPGFLAGALFIPSLALLLGVVGKAEQPLQILMLIAWYLGPMNGLPPQHHRSNDRCNGAGGAMILRCRQPGAPCSRRPGTPTAAEIPIT